MTSPWWSVLGSVTIVRSIIYGPLWITHRNKATGAPFSTILEHYQTSSWLPRGCSPTVSHVWLLPCWLRKKQPGDLLQFLYYKMRVFCKNKQTKTIIYILYIMYIQCLTEVNTPLSFFYILLYLFMWQHWRNDTLLQCKVVSVQLI